METTRLRRILGFLVVIALVAPVAAAQEDTNLTDDEDFADGFPDGAGDEPVEAREDDRGWTGMAVILGLVLLAVVAIGLVVALARRNDNPRDRPPRGRV